MHEGRKMIIGLSAKLDCGKTTLANMLLDKYPEYTRIGFGDLLKQECSETYHYPLEWNYSEEGKQKIIIMHSGLLPRKGMTIREILQWHGTEFRRAQDPDYWTKRMKDALVPNMIIDDMRFKNEAKFIKSHDGILIRIHPYSKWKPGKFASHKSEIDLDNYTQWDFVFEPEFGELEKYMPAIERLIYWASISVGEEIPTKEE